MQSKPIFDKSLTECGHIRTEINQVHYKRMYAVARLFSKLFESTPQVFRYIKDMMYYKGGWPKSDTPARAVNLARQVATAHAYLTYVGDTDLADALSDLGVSITVTDRAKFDAHFPMKPDVEQFFDPKFKDEWEALGMPTYATFVDDADVMLHMLKEGMECQRNICGLADTIKDVAVTIEAQCGVKPRNFKRAVAIESSRLQRRMYRRKAETMKAEGDDEVVVASVFLETQPTPDVIEK